MRVMLPSASQPLTEGIMTTCKTQEVQKVGHETKLDKLEAARGQK